MSKLVLFFLFCCSISSANDKWVRISSPTMATMRNCCYVDPLNAWAAGDSGIIIHTSNGGANFEIQKSDVRFYINDIYFINKRLGWVIANENVFEGAVILKTTNGGANWQHEKFYDSTVYLRTIYFSDSLTGFVGGFQGAIFRTTNAGVNWQRMKVDSSEFSGFPISRFKFSSGQTGFACGGYIDIAGVIWRTTNGGDIWSAQACSPEPFYDFYVINEQNVVSVGGDFEYGVQISKTFNSGQSWSYHSLGIFGQSYSVDFRTGSEIWMALGYAQAWAVSADTGSTWTTIPTTDSTIIYSVSFADSMNGLAVGADGVILKYSHPSIVLNESINTLHDFDLNQNYPNPFNPETIIDYELRIAGYVSLKVYDVTGNEAATLVEEKLPAGKHSVKFNGEKFSSGIYFYCLNMNGNQLARKMFLIK